MESRRRMVELKGACRLAFVLLALLAFCGARAALAGPVRAAAPSSGLRVDGARLLLDGRPVVLRGVAMGDPVLARRQDWDPRPLSDYAVVHDSWRAGVVRLSIHPSLWKRGDRAEVLSALDADVGAALGQGMCVIIDWHVIGWPDGVYEVPPPSWGDPPDLYDSDFALATSFWETVAPRYADRQRVAYELWNEPMSAEDRGWPRRAQWSDLRPYWVRLLRTVRASADNLVLAAGNQWSYDLRGVRSDPLDDENVAYAWHLYSGHDESDPRRWAEKLDAVQKMAPVIVTEWGFDPREDAPYQGTARSFGYRWVKRFLDGRRLHSTAWCWQPNWTPSLLKDWRTPSAYGRYVRQYLRHRAPLVTCTPATGRRGGVARVRFRVRDAGPQVRLWLRVDGGRARQLGWRAANGALTARVSCALSRGRHTYTVTAENLIARSSSATSTLVVR